MQYASSIPLYQPIKRHDVHIETDPKRLADITALLTPAEILSQPEFDHPRVIFPTPPAGRGKRVITNFSQLILYREEIRTLRLLPIKNDEIHAKYNSLDKSKLIDDINLYFVDTDIIFMRNEYPYWLPSDVGQYIIWLKSDIVDYVGFIGGVISLLGLGLDDIVMFERPKGITQKLIKGTLPKFRHIHFWVKHD